MITATPYKKEDIPEWCQMSEPDHFDGMGGCWGITFKKVANEGEVYCKKCQFHKDNDGVVTLYCNRCGGAYMIKKCQICNNTLYTCDCDNVCEDHECVVCGALVDNLDENYYCKECAEKFAETDAWHSNDVLGVN